MIKGVQREPPVGIQSTPTQIVETEAIQKEKIGDASFCIGIGFRVGVEHVLRA